MKPFEALVAEAEAADVSGWGFDWLDGRASEERPPWGYARLLAQQLASVESALDLDTGGGEVVDEAPCFPPRMYATEAWSPNARKAQARLGARGVQVVETVAGAALPFADGSFALVTSRHPVCPDWAEIHRVLQPAGHYFGQHVGPASSFELIEHFLGPLPVERQRRDPQDEAAAAMVAGLTVTQLRTARCRMLFHDVGAVVWILRKCVWWVPDFSVAKYHDELLALDRQMRQGEPFVSYSTRHLIEARR
ncbi:methyltransferase domain-containing protein [Massilia rubra]|uniref:Class I SAM-dependent methyltransferase n=1 Tax=Massilia rubra TaxID=2607910 RepID=A0ABX0LKX3_9BURK|nr:methyltransferase domain-containing protein [Massilia rubra]NHZ33303.1 class I SAM-dependent methyltransferase [Massilia rubra]